MTSRDQLKLYVYESGLYDYQIDELIEVVESVDDRLLGSLSFDIECLLEATKEEADRMANIGRKYRSVAVERQHSQAQAVYGNKGTTKDSDIRGLRREMDNLTQRQMDQKQYRKNIRHAANQMTKKEDERREKNDQFLHNQKRAILRDGMNDDRYNDRDTDKIAAAHRAAIDSELVDLDIRELKAKYNAASAKNTEKLNDNLNKRNRKQYRDLLLVKVPVGTKARKGIDKQNERVTNKYMDAENRMQDKYEKRLKELQEKKKPHELHGYLAAKRVMEGKPLSKLKKS